jgi:hypothetical protein
MIQLLSRPWGAGACSIIWRGLAQEGSGADAQLDSTAAGGFNRLTIRLCRNADTSSARAIRRAADCACASKRLKAKLRLIAAFGIGASRAIENRGLISYCYSCDQLSSQPFD